MGTHVSPRAIALTASVQLTREPQMSPWPEYQRLSEAMASVMCEVSTGRFQSAYDRKRRRSQAL